MFGPLSIESNDAAKSSLRSAGVLALPVAVETAAQVLSLKDELHLLINRPGATSTVHLRLLPSAQEFEQLPALPMVAAGACECAYKLLVTGADEAGHPFVLSLDADGKLLWQTNLDVASPARWPVPACAPQPLIAWQSAHGKLDAASCGPEGIGERHAFDVGGPPLSLACGNQSLLAAWGEAAGILCLEITEGNVRRIHVPATFPSEVAVGACSDGACLAWMQSDAAFFTRTAAEANVVATHLQLDLQDAGGGKLALVSGPQPLVWASRAELDTAHGPRWINALVLPGKSPLVLDGFVHAAAWWGERLAVVGSQELRLFERVNE